MKKVIRYAIWVVILLTMMGGSVLAAGSCVQLGETKNAGVLGDIQRKYITFRCTGDGSIAAYTFNPKTFGVWGWYLYNVTTDPGAVAPTAAYDITLVVNDEDIAGALLADRSATVNQTVAIAPTTLGYHVMDNDMVITIAGETANPSTFDITFRFTTN